jgi:hypothetical protein
VSNPSARGAIVFEAEGSFGEDVTTFAGGRVPHVGKIDLSGLKHEKIDSQRLAQRRQDGTQWILGTQTGTFKTKFYLTGHGTTTSGATTVNAIVETLLGKVFGNVAASAAAGSTFTGTGTAVAPATTASGTFSAGSLCRAGAPNDGRGNGQFLPVSTHAATTLNLLLAMDNPPSAADVLYSAVNVYPSEDPINGTAVSSIRLLVQTTNLQYELHGCFASAIAIGGLNPGEIPYAEITWTVAWWRYSIATFPSAVTTETFQPAPNAAGSLVVQDVGTTTRAKRTYRKFELTYKLGVVALEGSNTVSPYQTIVGARRTVDEITVSWVEDSDSPATTTPVLPGFATATTFKQLMLTLNSVAGKAVGIYLSNVCVTEVPIQFDDAEINRLKITGMAYTAPTTTNDLTASAFRMGLA